MLNSMRISASVKLPQSKNPYDSLIHSPRISQSFPFSIFKSPSSIAGETCCSRRFCAFGAEIPAPTAWKAEGSLGDLDEQPLSLELAPICTETQFDGIMAEAEALQQLVVIVWMAKWCRKCIYLKPKLEKLAAEYYPSIRFYSVDVSVVPHKLVALAGVTLWKGRQKQSEVIGGLKSHFVVNEIREMIENECAT